MRAATATLHALDARGPKSRRVVVDADGAILGPDCVLVRRISAGYRCTSLDEAARIQNVLRHQFEGPDWLFRQCCRIAKALADGHLSVAQICGLFIRTQPLDDDQMRRLAALAPLIKAIFNPDEARGGLIWATSEATELGSKACPRTGKGMFAFLSRN